MYNKIIYSVLFSFQKCFCFAYPLIATILLLHFKYAPNMDSQNYSVIFLGRNFFFNHYVLRKIEWIEGHEIIKLFNKKKNIFSL